MSSILTLNAGSSSLKFALFDAEATPERRAWGQVERIGEDACLQIEDSGGQQDKHHLGDDCSASEALDAVLDALADYDQPDIVGHRIVHGGDDFTQPIQIDHTVLSVLEGLDSLAPLHQPHNLAAVRHFLENAPDLPQIGVFDTAFHADMPDVARWIGLPKRFHQRGIRRYGFHGLSYQHAAGEMARLEPASSRVVVAHLGNGASLCGIRNGHSVETTMGFSALDGLLMGTRCGRLDPGVLLHLMRVDQMGLDDLQELLYQQSGLLGVSGISHDVRELLAADNDDARLALELFVYRVIKETGALYSVLGGLDALVFTGGIGEHAASIRQAIAAGLAWTGLKLDPQANAGHAAVLHADSSRLSCRIVRCDEEQVLADACAGML
ncbi:MAG: acetate/propionate family kinase [Wenzhouxiangellaceae bacterium]|nr:acetate/propionate family kinase [Wenzhouxiangellaceae bacterium]